MSQRDHYEPGVPCWIDTGQRDVERAMSFYGALLSWEFVGPGPMAGDPEGRYYVARVRGRDVAGVSSLPPGAPEPPSWRTHVAVANADEAAARARQSGGQVLVEPFDAMPAGRMAVVGDPAGAVFALWQAGARQGAQLVNEPSAWAMSALHTADAERSAPFYAALFDWRLEPFAPGVALFRLPGFVGGEPHQPVPRDVVAVVVEDGGPSHWSVDVWVAGADDVAARAVELGGSVVVEPHDLPGFRNAVIRDPQGAVLSVSQLVLPGPANP